MNKPPPRPPSPPKVVPFEEKYKNEIDYLVESTQLPRPTVIRQLKAFDGDTSQAMDSLFEMIPKPVDKVRYEIQGRLIKALRALQGDPSFIMKYKDISISKEELKKEKKADSKSGFKAIVSRM